MKKTNTIKLLIKKKKNLDGLSHTHRKQYNALCKQEATVATGLDWCCCTSASLPVTAVSLAGLFTPSVVALKKLDMPPTAVMEHVKKRGTAVTWQVFVLSCDLAAEWKNSVMLCSRGRYTVSPLQLLSTWLNGFLRVKRWKEEWKKSILHCLNSKCWLTCRPISVFDHLSLFRCLEKYWDQWHDVLEQDNIYHALSIWEHIPPLLYQACCQILSIQLWIPLDPQRSKKATFKHRHCVCLRTSIFMLFH